VKCKAKSVCATQFFIPNGAASHRTRTFGHAELCVHYRIKHDTTVVGERSHMVGASDLCAQKFKFGADNSKQFLVFLARFSKSVYADVCV
jgi:hypothetical protein